jgi:hypothetical protein
LKTQVSGIATAVKMADRAFLAMGISSAAVMAIGIRGASELQGATVQAAIALGKTGDTIQSTTTNMKDFQQMALKMSDYTAMSLPQAMGVMATMASSGLTAQQINSDQRGIAQFVDILHLGKDKMDYAGAATLGAGLVHDMRLGLSGNAALDAQQTTYGLGRIAQMGYLSPHGLPAVTTQVRRMASVLENVLPGTTEQKADTIVGLAAWVDRLGNLPFAGSAISQMTTQMISPRSERVAKGLEQLGVLDPGRMVGRKYVAGNNKFFDMKTGTFDLMGAIKAIQGSVQAGRDKGMAGDAVKALFSGTQNMQRILQALATPEALNAYKLIQNQMKGFGNDPAQWMDKTQALLMQELGSQTQRLITNFQSLATLIASPFMKPLTEAIQGLADTLAGWSKIMQDHPKVAATIGGGMLVAAGYAVTRLAMMGGRIFTVLEGIGKGHIGAEAGNTIWHNLFRGGATSAAVGAGAATAGGGVVGGLIGGISGMIGGLFKGVGSVFTSLFGLGSIKAFGAEIGRLGSIFTFFGRQAITTRGGLMLVAETLGKLGLRLIPVVGQVWFAIDLAVQAFKHSTDIAWMLGRLTGWMQYKLWPGIVNAWNSGITFIGAAFMGAIHAVMTNIAQFVANPLQWFTNVQKNFDNMGSGMGNAAGKWAQQIGAAYLSAQAQSRPGYQTIEQMTHARHMALHAQHGGAPQRTREVHHTSLVVNVTAPAGTKDPKKFGDLAGQAIAHRLSTRATNSVIAIGTGLTGNHQSPAH